MVDPNDIYREGLKTFIETINDIQIIINVTNEKELIPKLETTGCDILIIDINSAATKYDEVIETIKEKHSEIKIIATTAQNDRELIQKIYELKINGILFKNDKPTQFRSAIQSITNGGTYFSEDIFKHITRNNSYQYQYHFTKREIQILTMVSEGQTNSNIAEKLNISIKSVEAHKHNMISKSDTHNLAELAVYAIKSNQLRI